MWPLIDSEARCSMNGPQLYGQAIQKPYAGNFTGAYTGSYCADTMADDDENPQTGSLPTTTQSQPTFSVQPPAVDFIENQLGEYHPAFEPSMVHYDAALGQFVAHVPINTAMTQSHVGQTLAIPVATAPAPARPEQGPIAHMEFWDRIFPQAMERLNSEDPIPTSKPPRKYDLEWSIRHMTHWEDVQDKLDKARRAYEFDDSGVPSNGGWKGKGGRFRRKMRSFMDTHHVTAQQAMQVVPDVEIASPIIGMINLMLDVSRPGS
jgi:hypothetical protein